MNKNFILSYYMIVGLSIIKNNFLYKKYKNRKLILNMTSAKTCFNRIHLN